ncbi:sigma factor [Streptomyces longwoodensis]
MRSRLRAGQPAAFAELFDTYARGVYNHAFRLTADWSTAEEVMATTFLEAWKLRHRIDPEGGSLRPWLLGIATNTARNQYRSNRRHRRAAGTFSSGAALASPGARHSRGHGRVPAVPGPQETAIPRGRRTRPPGPVRRRTPAAAGRARGPVHRVPGRQDAPKKTAADGKRRRPADRQQVIGSTPSGPHRRETDERAHVPARPGPQGGHCTAAVPHRA